MDEQPARAISLFTTADARFAWENLRRCDVDVELLVHTQAYLRVLAERGVASLVLREAWERFFLLHDPKVRGLVWTCFDASDDQDDIVQEVWFEIIKRITEGSYDPRRGRFRCWISMVIRNKVIDLARAHGRKCVSEFCDLEAVPCHRLPDPAVSYERRRQQQVVRGAMKDLKERISVTSYQALQLYWIEGRSVIQVAADLGLTPDQVRARQHRAKVKLKRLLKTRHVENSRAVCGM